MRYNYLEDGNFLLLHEIKDDYGFFANFPLSNNEMINLCGGIPSEEVESVYMDVKAVSPVAIRVEIETELYNLCRTFNFDRRIIFNSGLYVDKPGNSIGTTLFFNQVKTARQYKFERINVVAEGPDIDNKYTGHYKWGRMGFKMNQSDLTEFHIWISRLKRNEYTLGELLLTEEGCRVWKLGGFTWSGKFYLDNDSESMNYMKDYIDRIGSDFKL